MPRNLACRVGVLLRSQNDHLSLLYQSTPWPIEAPIVVSTGGVSVSLLWRPRGRAVQRTDRALGDDEARSSTPSASWRPITDGGHDSVLPLRPRKLT
jgi:hypothetical protein